jgi:hypothetical protein
MGRKRSQRTMERQDQDSLAHVNQETLQDLAALDATYPVRKAPNPNRRLSMREDGTRVEELSDLAFEALKSALSTPDPE